MPYVEWMDFYRSLIDCGLFILIWLVQLIIYPSFEYIDRLVFQRWHYHYTGLISLFVAPLMFSESAIYLWSALTQGRWHDWFGCVLIAVIWFATITLSVPCHDAMQKRGYDRTVIRRLVNTNWIRTAAWTILFGIDLFGIDLFGSDLWSQAFAKGH